MRSQVGSITPIDEGVWRVQVSAGIDPVTGKRRRPARIVRGSLADARLALSRLLLEVGTSTTSTRSMTLSAYVDGMWLPFIEDRVRKLTYNNYSGLMRLHVIPTLGQVRIDKLEPYRLDKWLSGLQSDGLSARSRLHCYRVLHGALVRAVKWRIIPSNPLDAVDAPKVKAPDPDVLTLEEANAYLDAFEGHPLEAVVLIALNGGLRRSELAGLDWSVVNLRAGTVNVVRGMHERKGEVWYEPPKTDRSRRTVSLSPWCVEALRRLRAVGPIAVENGAAMTPNRMSYLYGRHVTACGLRKIPLKNLRHTSGTLALAEGVDIVTVSRRLGHSTVTTTDTFYVRPGKTADDKAAQIMESMRTKKAK